jgi:hypothetical protein
MPLAPPMNTRRIIRAWIRKDVQPDVLTIDQQLRAVATHSA